MSSISRLDGQCSKEADVIGVDERATFIMLEQLPPGISNLCGI